MELEDSGPTVNSQSLSNQLLPFKKHLNVDQAHAAQVHVNIDRDYQLWMVSIPPLNELVTIRVVAIQ